jgi:hypothetical protein
MRIQCIIIKNIWVKKYGDRSEPLFAHYGKKKICIVDNGCMWLHHFPIGKFHSVTLKNRR